MTFFTSSAACLCGAAALALTTTAAMAQEHLVLVLSDAYFPDITHVKAGDTVTFINASETTQNVVSESEAWSVGPIPVQGQLSMIITAGQETTFFNAATLDGDADEGVSGYLSFEPAPTN
ncbi:MAG: hypothetical protein HRU30_01665 [Rhodobacteraceae bacterium]|nr:hypothetical protein [Paracoccaceae bacterium]